MRCSEEIPSVRRVEQAFAARGLKVLWIGFQDQRAKVRAYIEKQGIHQEVGFDDGDLLAKKLGIRYGAGVVIINEAGIVKKRVAKGFSEKGLHDAVRASLAQARGGS